MSFGNQSQRRRFRTALEQMRPKRIIVHAGRIKTGSTFLQSALMQARAPLLQHGWLFSSQLMYLSSFQNEHRALRAAGHLALARLALGFRVSSHLLDGFAAEASDHTGKDVLFSTEILGRDPAEQGMSGLKPVLDGFDVEILIYLRRPSDWVNSYFMENVTGGLAREHRPFDALADGFVAAADATGFVDQIRTWEKPPKLRFRNYDLARQAKGGLLADFCTSLGLPEIPKPELQGVNTSPSHTVAQGARVFNGLTLGVASDRYQALYTELLDRLSRFDDGAKGSFIAPEEALGLDARWLERNRLLVEGGYMETADFEALAAPRPGVGTPAPDPVVEGRILSEICKFLQEKGITGFEMSPTVGGVGQEWARRVKRAVQRRMVRRDIQ